MEINIQTLKVTEVEVEPGKAQIAHQEPTVTIVELDGEVTYSTAPLVETQVLPLAQPQVKLILDMTKVPYMSSAGLRMLLSLYRQVTAKEGQIVLVGLVEEIRDAMSITGFLDFFRTCDALEEALTLLNVQAAVLPTS